MEHAEITPVLAKGSPDTSNILFEVSPNGAQEEIVEIDVTGSDKMPTILKPTEELENVRISFTL